MPLSPVYHDLALTSQRTDQGARFINVFARFQGELRDRQRVTRQRQQ
jgi:hypothetical protein